MRLAWILAVVFCVLADSVSAAPADNSNDAGLPALPGCTTPDGLPGRCVLLSKCSSALRLLGQKPLTKGTKDKLRRSQCTRCKGTVPFVCCPGLDPIESTTSPPRASQTASPATTTSAKQGSQMPISQHANLGLLSAGLPEGASCGTGTQEKILGGNSTELGDFPWMALLQLRRVQNGELIWGCGGALINDRYVLTAAHCRGNQAATFTGLVRLGEHNIRVDPDCRVDAIDQTKFCAHPVQDFANVQMVSQPEYTSTQGKSGDIALLRLPRRVEFSEYIWPVCLPTTDEPRSKYIGRSLTVVGWGKTENGSGSDVKLLVKVPVVAHEACASVYRNKYDRTLWEDKQLCAGGKAGEDSCQGDSGGPLMEAAKEHWFAVGVVSFGPKICGSNGIPGVYTRVAHHMNWILDNLQP